MIRTKYNDQNYLEITVGAPIPADLLASVGIDPELGRGTRHELATYTCSHCQTQLIVNPWRTRERAWCPKCDKYICDTCKAQLVLTGVCKPMSRLVDEFAEAADRGQPLSIVDAYGTPFHQPDPDPPAAAPASVGSIIVP